MSRCANWSHHSPSPELGRGVEEKARSSRLLASSPQSSEGGSWSTRTPPTAGESPALFAGERYDLYGEGRVISIENSTKVSYHRGVPFDYRSQLDFTTPGTNFGSVVWEASHRQSTLENNAIFIQGIFGELLDFCDAVLEWRQPVVGTLEFALHVMQVYEAALLSDSHAVTIGV